MKRAALSAFYTEKVRGRREPIGRSGVGRGKKKLSDDINKCSGMCGGSC